MQIIILVSNFYDFVSDKVEIGGLQTYIRDLAQLCATMNHQVTILQLNPSFEDKTTKEIGNLRICNVVPCGSLQRVFDETVKNNPDALYILSTDQIRIKMRNVKCVQIQHGIAFDIPGNMISGFWGKTKWLQFVNKCLRCLNNVRRLSQSRHTVCVDYNYYNWYRTIGTIRSNERITVIPNYASNALSVEELDKKLEKFDGIHEIVFARRFVDYRGTLLFADIVPQIIERHPYVNITFAGNGVLEDFLHERFDKVKNVYFVKYDSANSLDFHRKYDLAVIPSIFSEGTSLSLCEAMAAACLPICTHVGGMTNIVLDGYNGFMVPPLKDELLDAIERALNLSQNEYASIVRNAHACAITSFSHDHWSNAWKNVIKSYS